jgi:hypothetical protein
MHNGPVFRDLLVNPYIGIITEYIDQSYSSFNAAFYPAEEVLQSMSQQLKRTG